METGTWVGPVAAVLAVGGVTAVFFAAFLPETRPATLVGGLGLLLTALLLDGVARIRRRRAEGGPFRVPEGRDAALP
ncbi:hypothetical protein ACI79C_03995 [Geodermatophilus sp. SYSU D00697]